MLLIDVSFTSHCTAPTGVQRVTREVCRELTQQGKALPVCFDRWHGQWRKLNETEQSRIDSPQAARYANYRHRWSVAEATAGMFSRWCPPLAQSACLPADALDGLLVPEKLENRTVDEIRLLRRRLSGASVAVFHDLIPVKFPEYASRRSSVEFPRYLDLLLNYDGVAAVSESSKEDLLDYWRKNRARNPPPVEAISPGTGLSIRESEVENSHSESRARILMVGTVEARKNHRAVLEACERLWAQGCDFELILAGRLSRDTGGGVLEQVRMLQGRNRPLRWVGHVGDDELERLYGGCRFTVHPSLYEGFGLPVLESLSHAKPCVISARGALSQVAKGGGCYVVDDPESKALAAAIRSLLLDPALYDRLVRECRQREFKRWDRYCDELARWQRSLKKRPLTAPAPVERGAVSLGPRFR